MKKYRLAFDILSPVHIGTGHEINPLEYIIQAGVFQKVSLEKYVFSMNDAKRDQFERLVEEGNLVKLRKNVSENVKKDHVAYSVAVSPKIEALYNSKLVDPQNQLLINPFVRTQDQSVPLFPGSSVKGAIRTAVISEIAKISGLPKPVDKRGEYEFESKVLGYKDGKDDPFRAIKIRDVHLPADSTMIREIRNVFKGRSGGLQTNDIQMICEVTHSQMTGRPVSFGADIFIDDDLFSTHFLSKSITIEHVIHSCRIFYKDKMEKEHQKFYKNSESETPSSHLLNTTLSEGSFLLRIGRFSGAESVTLDGYRNPRPPGDKGWGGTRNLAAGIYPMGWLRVEVVS
jgi:CRISPR-associated protein Csm5